jgi:hypothetical protein
MRVIRWTLRRGSKHILERSPIVFCCPNMEQPWFVSEAKAYGCLVLGYAQVLSATVRDKIIQLTDCGLEDIVTFIENALSKYPSWPHELKDAITNGVADSQTLDKPYSNRTIWDAWNKIFTK